MALDPSIALQVKQPQFDNPLAQMAQFSAVQNAQNQNQLAQYTLSKARREDEDTQAVRNLLTGAGGDLEAGYNALLRGGHLEKALAIKKQQLEQQEKQSTIGKNNAAADKSKVEISTAQRQQLGQTLGALAQMPNVTPQMVATAIQHHGDMFGVPPERVQASLSTIPQDPAQLKVFLDTKMREVMKPEDLMKYTAPDANTVANNRTSIAVGAGHDRTSLAVGAGHDAATLAGQGKGQVVQTDQGTMVVDPRAGTAQPVMANGQPLQPKLKDLPAPIQKAYLENSTAMRKIDSALEAIDAYPGGLGSKNLLGDSIRQRTDPNGVEVRALIADIGSLKIHDRSGAAVTVAEMPRLAPFIPQATDSPATAKKKIDLFKKELQAVQDDIAATYTREQGYKSPQQKVKDAVDSGAADKLTSLKPVSIRTAADYHKLPSGTVYTDPSGTQRTKP